VARGAAVHNERNKVADLIEDTVCVGALGGASQVRRGSGNEQPEALHNRAGNGGRWHAQGNIAASACSSAAEICVGHCVEMLAGGDKTLAACAASSREVAVVCNGLRSLAAQNSAYLASYAKVAAEICKSCEAECRKHSEHIACKNCGDACVACAGECGKVA
jgi:Cys-rich four helix bundle protein (predicted Tat secretion target)